MTLTVKQSRYKKLLQKFLPLGALWNNVNNVFDSFVEAFAIEPARVDDGADALMLENNPATTTLLLAEYESMALNSEELPSSGDSTSKRQQVLAAKMNTAYSGPSKAFFISLALKLGMTVTVLDGGAVSAAVVARVEVALVDQDTVSDEHDVFTWEIHVVSDPNTQLAKLKAMVERLKPAHTNVIYT